MKKRILSCLMALALCLTLLPTAALAEGTAENVAEVTISDGTTRSTPTLWRRLPPRRRRRAPR